ncbi:radical SAM protein [Vibrio parahaemolyticus]|nr:radical SAM protein [Vibrio parahaemolyticus]
MDLTNLRNLCWRITKKCNRKCEFCLASSHKGYELTSYDIDKVVNRLVELKVNKIIYAGGEPLIHPQFPSIVSAMSNTDITQVLTTNGDKLRRHIPDWIDIIDGIRVSFYGNKITHDRIMGNGHFEMLSKLVKVLSQRVKCSVNLMLHKGNIDNIEELLYTFSSLGANRILLLSYVRTGLESIDSKYEISQENKEVLNEIKYSNYLPNGVLFVDFDKIDNYLVMDERLNLTRTLKGKKDTIEVGNIFDDSVYIDKSKVFLHDYLDSIWVNPLRVEGVRAL